tara:strand:- start:254 stop:859 length:606 start_codon:yes stop_codon:yes gene_type:complete
MAEEPKKLRSIKELLSLFKPGGLEKLLLKMKSKKQGFEIEGQLGKINAATMLEEYNPEIGGYENTTDTMFDVLDSLKTEKAETDSLLQILEQDVFEGSNVETESDIDLDSSDVVKDFVFGMLGGTKAKALMNVSAKLGLKKGASKGLENILKESDINRLNTAFGKKNFFNILRGLEKGLIDPTSNAYKRALRYKKVYDELF